ncbi:MAG: thioredoxin family protein [bacterium]
MKTKNYFIASMLFLLNFSTLYSQTSSSFNEGLNAAKTSGKKVFIEVYTDSDNWSKKMDSEVFSSAKVQGLLSDFVFVKLDPEATGHYSFGKKEYSGTELAKFFGATGYPTFVVLNSDGSVIKFKYNGEEVSNISGFVGADDLAEMLNYFLQNKYKDTDLSTVFQN